MIKEIRYGRSEYLKLIIPVYVVTDSKTYVWSESDLIYFDDIENMCSLGYIMELAHRSK